MRLITLLKRFRTADYLGLDTDFTGALQMQPTSVGIHSSRCERELAICFLANLI